jgi:hypothetical protein
VTGGSTGSASLTVGGTPTVVVGSASTVSGPNEPETTSVSDESADDPLRAPKIPMPRIRPINPTATKIGTRFFASKKGTD